MILDELERIVPEPLSSQLRGLYAQYIGTSSGGDMDGFVEQLRKQGHISAEVFREVHARDDVSIDGLDGLAGRSLPQMEARPAIMEDEEPTQSVPALQERHQVLGLIGSGGMATVHVARDTDLGRKVAYKVLMPTHKEVPELVNRFCREVQVIAQLDHPNIVPVYDLELSPPLPPAYSMKLVQGQTLRELLDATARHHERGEPLPPELSRERRLEHFVKVCDALAHAHAKGVIHRDLKPDNVMIGRFGAVYVMDWGLARVLGKGRHEERVSVVQRVATEPGIGEKTQVGAVLGSPGYMPPEQALGKHDELDPRADIYALGLLLQELLTLTQPIPGNTQTSVLMAASKGERAPLVHVAGTPLPPELCAVVRRATELEPPRRYPSAEAMAEDVRHFLHDEPVSVHPEGPSRKLQRWLARHRQTTLLILAGFFLLAAASLGWGLYRQGSLTRAARMREARLTQFTTAVARQASHIDYRLLRLEARLEGLAATTVQLLAREPDEEERVFLAKEFLDPRRGPPDVAESPRYGSLVSVDWPVFTLAPGVEHRAARDDLHRLGPLRHHLRRALLASHSARALEVSPARQRRLIKDEGVPITWAFVALERGAHLGYPGQGGYPADFDPRKRPWYRLSARKTGVHWGNPYVDVKGQGLLLPCSTSLYDDDGEFLGVVGIDLTFRYVIDSLLELGGGGSGEQTYLLDAEGRVVVGSADRERRVRAGLHEDKALDLAPYFLPEVVEGARTEASGWVRAEHDGRRLIVAWVRLQALGWSYVAEADARKVLGGD